MSNQIKQVQAHYLPLEDRILLKIHTDEKQVFQAWITRRYLKLLLPTLQGQHPQTGESILLKEPSPEAEAFLEDSTNFEQPYQPPESPEFPLGQEPVLLSKITFQGFDTDSPELILEPEDGLGIALSYQPGFIKALATIINQAMSHAEWQLDMFIHQLPGTHTLQ